MVNRCVDVDEADGDYKHEGVNGLTRKEGSQRRDGETNDNHLL